MVESALVEGLTVEGVEGGAEEGAEAGVGAGVDGSGNTKTN